MEVIMVRADKLIKIYGKGHLAVKVLEIPRLEIKKGEMVALTGPSGCGKTTLLNLIGGLDRPSGGNILVGNRSLGEMSEGALCLFRRNNVGFVFQAYNLFQSLSAIDNVLMPSLPSGRVDSQRARELLSLVGLAGKEKRKPGHLSWGEQQRVAIARALYPDPALLLADEPTGNLDAKSGAGILELLISLNNRGKTLIIATHDSRVAGACHRQIALVDEMPA